MNVLNEYGEMVLYFVVKYFYVNKGNVLFDCEGVFEKVLYCLIEDFFKFLVV